MEHRGWMTSGAFAALCGATKETLRHYKDLGLLLPAHRGENGYFYYDAEQFYDFYAIAIFRQTGTPLAEIRRCLGRQDAGETLDLLRVQREALEEERRLCYVGITRAMKRLTITSAKMRMVRGETRFSKVSRFVSEIPRELLSGTVATGKSIPQPEVSRRISPYAGSAKQILREKPVLRAEAKSFSTDATDGMSLGYKKGDRVRHMKFGEGIVTQIVAGGRDYEVTVDFDRAGTKKMFASFAKLKKV